VQKTLTRHEEAGTTDDPEYEAAVRRALTNSVEWLLGRGYRNVLLEVAKRAFSAYVRSFNPGSFYSGTVAALVIVVIWVYYAALIFIIGGEVAQVYELRRVRKRQREAFED